MLYKYCEYFLRKENFYKSGTFVPLLAGSDKHLSSFAYLHVNFDNLPVSSVEILFISSLRIEMISPRAFEVKSIY